MIFYCTPFNQNYEHIQFSIENEITIKVDKFTLFLSMLCCEIG
jgi:hypothetical protein